jgi:hypothetical protein
MHHHFVLQQSHFIAVFFHVQKAEHVRKFPRSGIFLFLNLVQLFLQEKYSVSVCFNARIFVFYLSLLYNYHLSIIAMRGYSQKVL